MELTKLYAVKSFPNHRAGTDDAIALSQEINLLREVQSCEQIADLHEVVTDPNRIYVVLEYFPGEYLEKRVLARGSYPEAEARMVLRHILQAVQYCHARRIAIRNLLCNNIMLPDAQNDTIVKIVDFGLAKRVVTPNCLTTACGQEDYIAPELLAEKPAYDVSCDMWSIGVILYYVLGGYRPFRGENVKRRVCNGKYKFHPEHWGEIGDGAKNLIRQLLHLDPTKRLTAEDALSRNAWVRNDEG